MATFCRACIEGTILIPLVTRGQGNRTLILIQRTDGAQIGRTGQAGGCQAGFRSLVDNHGAEQFGRVLVELDTAVVTCSDLLAAIQQCRGEVRAQATDRDDLRAATKALRSQTRQARQGFCDGVVRQLADVLGRNGLNDRR